MSPTGGGIKAKDGFTLIELVVSVGLLCLVLTAAFSLYGFGTRAYDRDLKDIEMQQNARQAVMKLSSSIRLAREVHILSRDYIRIVTPNGENVDYYLQNGVLYRVRNDGKNPVAKLKTLTFVRPEDKNYIEILVSAEEGDKAIEIKTKATPFGAYIQ
ncbi:PilW family protein [Thermoanaerobacterium sp. DL9XJH110]|uniref:PilW family protein n=1 Tax=Thermoanaerobacterium sp. DL9XJH110 TaxID=3386643 RepID=UPI003BB75048